MVPYDVLQGHELLVDEAILAQTGLGWWPVLEVSYDWDYIPGTGASSSTATCTGTWVVVVCVYQWGWSPITGWVIMRAATYRMGRR